MAQSTGVGRSRVWLFSGISGGVAVKRERGNGVSMFRRISTVATSSAGRREKNEGEERGTSVACCCANDGGRQYGGAGEGGTVASSLRKEEVRGKGAVGIAWRCSSELMEGRQSSDFNGYVEIKGKSRGTSGGCGLFFFGGLSEKIMKRRGMGVGGCYW
ncbi:hypothetical protein HAX54_049709 [Datura stramonium]|uniref:Uncharacterized protein n=1 Tax=Datura stramonium TaxID=4076 RepID=A0ABS8SX74_DATST|nr:hypothetical protein [Datura stramonium]